MPQLSEPAGAGAGEQTGNRLHGAGGSDTRHSGRCHRGTGTGADDLAPVGDGVRCLHHRLCGNDRGSDSVQEIRREDLNGGCRDLRGHVSGLQRGHQLLLRGKGICKGLCG